MNTTSCSATTSRFGFFERVFSSLSLCRLHCQQCSHRARRSVRPTSLLARSRAGRCATTQNMRVRTACTRASCAAKAGMEQVIAAPSQLLPTPTWCHHDGALNHSRFRMPQGARRRQCALRRLVERCHQMLQSSRRPRPHHHQWLNLLYIRRYLRRCVRSSKAASSRSFHNNVVVGRTTARGRGGGGYKVGTDCFTPSRRRMLGGSATCCGAGCFTLSRRRLPGESGTSVGCIALTPGDVHSRAGP